MLTPLLTLPPWLYRADALRAIEQAAARTLPPGTLMQRAGAAAATWIACRWPQARTVAVLCGPGNNGGDGYVCATELRRLGRTVHCVALAPPASSDAIRAAQAWHDSGGRTHPLPASLDGADLCVDALFGIGLTRPLGSAARAAVDAMRACGAPIVALDVPSGLSADSGAWVGDVPGVHAVATLSFLGAKPGLLTGTGVEACGELVIDTLGVELPSAPGRMVTPADFAAVLQPRVRDSHKGRFGNLWVVGGAPGMVGAALLAGRAGLRFGAGRVYVAPLDGSLTFDPGMPELMVRAPAALAEDPDAVAVIGCGLGTGDAARAALAAVLSRPSACVLDADALNLIAADVALRRLATQRRGPTVLTPHPLEAGRLLGSTVAQVQADRVTAAQALASTLNAWTVLKGAGSVIAAPRMDMAADGPADEARYWINPTGSPALATAGTGDVLAGMLGALLAQSYAPADAVRAAVWLHGRAADEARVDIGLVASDIAPRAAAALARLRTETAAR